MSWGRLILPVGFIGAWSVLRGFAVDAPVAFARVAVLAQTFQILKLFALVAFLMLVVNEALIAAQTALHVRVITLSLAPIALHFLFHILLRMTCPRLDEGDA